jgi:hypothetical protein
LGARDTRGRGFYRSAPGRAMRYTHHPPIVTFLDRVPQDRSQSPQTPGTHRRAGLHRGPASAPTYVRVTRRPAEVGTLPRGGKPVWELGTARGRAWAPHAYPCRAGLCTILDNTTENPFALVRTPRLPQSFKLPSVRRGTITHAVAVCGRPGLASGIAAAGDVGCGRALLGLGSGNPGARLGAVGIRRAA